MHQVVLVLACLVCASHGRRMSFARESQSNPNTVSQQPSKAIEEDTNNPLKALSNFLLTLHPVAVFNPSRADKPIVAGLRSRALDGRSRVGLHAPMMSMEDETSISGLEIVEPKLLRAPPQIEMQMRTIDGAPIGPPPDMPSLLLDERIVYIGAPLVPSVAELVVAELLYLNFNKPDEDVQMYINSVGTAGGATETDAFAILDTMNYVTPQVGTCCVGSAFGTAAMLLAAGTKGKRVCLPNAQIVLLQPSSQTRGQASDIAIRAREVLATRTLLLKTLSELTGQTVDQIQSDTSRTKYLSPEQALAYGIIDKVADTTKATADLAATLS
mmetsp:Transcript_7982/g.14883  ORF Transcript_7982/g.14883 Transcript_7982/m.14883 type:complete len:328 (-) Transcript_7982:62-1045(-)